MITEFLSSCSILFFLSACFCMFFHRNLSFDVLGLNLCISKFSVKVSPFGLVFLSKHLAIVCWPFEVVCSPAPLLKDTRYSVICALLPVMLHFWPRCISRVSRCIYVLTVLLTDSDPASARCTCARRSSGSLGLKISHAFSHRLSSDSDPANVTNISIALHVLTSFASLS